MTEDEAIQELRDLLDEHPTDEDLDPHQVANLLSVPWHAFRGAETTKMRAEKLGRIEDLRWDPPILSFAIERHGQTGGAIGAVTGDPPPGGAYWDAGIGCYPRQRHTVDQVRSQHGHALRDFGASNLRHSIIRHGDRPCPIEDRSADGRWLTCRGTGNRQKPSLT